MPDLVGLNRALIFESIYLPYLLALVEVEAEVATFGLEAPENVGTLVQVPPWRDSFAWVHQVSETSAWNRPPAIDAHRGLVCRADARAEAERDAGAAIPAADSSNPTLCAR
ncbi:hypothetical protein MKK69_20265 [Methylobacterium sp. J-026]|uniref:hypothetical protein n=1 Tax=Methylobacterium sp. J-026 TaxID=2836624 RepID=UPI001FBAA193|nr:hypothetical protein [Methylobacterium sp. J-026]MCJ2136356.1 hypothetical protein [Methylobacterium sp. J-026]